MSNLGFDDDWRRRGFTCFFGWSSDVNVVQESWHCFKKGFSVNRVVKGVDEFREGNHNGSEKPIEYQCCDHASRLILVKSCSVNENEEINDHGH